MPPLPDSEPEVTLTVVILTKNEQRHIARAIGSVAGMAERVFVIDSGSTDNTVEMARAAGAEVLSNPWVNYATQFNWALDQLPADTDWVFRLDADEVVSDALSSEIKARLIGSRPLLKLPIFVSANFSAPSALCD